jgi:hypothetical protein
LLKKKNRTASKRAMLAANDSGLYPAQARGLAYGARFEGGTIDRQATTARSKNVHF